MHISGLLRASHRPARRLALASTGIALVAGVLPAAVVAAPFTAAVAHADDIMASQDQLRTGWDSAEPNLSPATVSTFSSTPRWIANVSGQVYAQPLVLGSTVIVATETDQVYGLNAGTGAVIWHKSLGSPFDIAADPILKTCTNITPDIGITGTPAYDPVTKDIFFFADLHTRTGLHYSMVQMDPTTGTEVSHTTITGHPSNDSSISFSPRYNMERPGVLVMGGAVYGAFASHCDKKPYDGFVTRVNISTHAMTLWSDESGVTYNQAGIWQSGGGIMSDGPGRIFLTSGNGVSPPKSSTPGGQLAESVIRLAVNSNGTLSAQDFFSPANAPSLDAADHDLGAGGPVGVPFAVGADNVLAQIGKDGRVFLLNRNGLGGREQGTNNTDNVLFASQAYAGEWGHPDVFGDPNAPVTVANSLTNPVNNDFLISVAKDDPMRVFRFAVNSSGTPVLSDVANSSLSFGYQSGSPVVTSNGNDPTSAVMWEVYDPNFKTSPNPTGANSVLEAYSLGNVVSNGTTPSPCTSTTPCTLTNIWTSSKFTSANFSIPATSQGWVYVGTRDGHVDAWSAPGAPAPLVRTAARTVAPVAPSAPLVGHTTTMPQTAVGSTSAAGVTVTATKTVTVTGATATTGASNATAPTSEFAAGQASKTLAGSSTASPVSFPVTLHKGDKLSVQTSFTPTVPGGSTGTLSLSISSSTSPTADVPLIGDATQAGLYAQPNTVTFPLAPDQGVIPVPIGIHVPETVNITNFGTTKQTITSVTPPSAPFTVTNMPAVGTKIRPGQTITVQVIYAPTSPGTATGSFTITGSSGKQAAVSLSGIGTPAVSQLTSSNPTVNFGTIPVGKKATADVQVTNAGNTQSLVTGTSSITAPFAAPLKPRAGMPFNSDSDMLLPVTFTPHTKGTFTTQYQLHWSDVNGPHTVTITLTGTAA